MKFGTHGDYIVLILHLAQALLMINQCLNVAEWCLQSITCRLKPRSLSVLQALLQSKGVLTESSGQDKPGPKIYITFAKEEFEALLMEVPKVCYG